jgi:hypothetical protein
VALQLNEPIRCVNAYSLVYPVYIWIVLFQPVNAKD